MKQPYFFGIRHLSPAGAYYLREFLEEKQPKLVLVEGPSDFKDMMGDMVKEETKPPIAILAYTKEAPVRTILYPFAEYSPEYQAVCWCQEKKRECRFMDLPSEVFLALQQAVEQLEWKEIMEQEAEGENNEVTVSEHKLRRKDVYERLSEATGEDGQETFWERSMEHVLEMEQYHQGSNVFGASLRGMDEKPDRDMAETVIREAYMCRQIKKAVAEGIAPEDIVVVTGSYHVEGLKLWQQEDGSSFAMTDQEEQSLKRVEASHTLMPYSYYRLSTRAGYGAGNKAPAYYELLWEGRKQQDDDYAASCYLTKLAVYQRNQGNAASSAQVIEALRLAKALAAMRGGATPTLRDLQDAAVTCLGEGNFAKISLAVADTEIGNRIGALPEGVSRTSIQEDFYRKLKEWNLEKYRDLTAQDLKLDLRENRKVVSKKSAFLDLHRSFFLHQLRVLGISFAKEQAVSQENATWAEHWVLRWTPESEIELVESALKGDTIAQAVSFVLKEQVEKASQMSHVAKAIEDAFFCGMAQAVQYATSALQGMAVSAVSVTELAETAHRLSVVVQYGNIRQVESQVLIPILQQLYYRSCLILADSCICDDSAAKEIMVAMEQWNQVALAHDFLEEDKWVHALEDTAFRDDLNTMLSGFAAAILMERSKLTTEQLRAEVQRRLSKGVPAELGAGWFEGLSKKNPYALIARLSLWESLDQYISSLEEEEFKRALVFLRRAFADFSAREKDQVAENLGEIWGLNGSQVSEVVNGQLDGDAMEVIEGLEDFDFDF
ncbi:MAG: hypothetical protein K2M46_12390 [Lachnospiraceae bacterium]|nr:hypothetical protein [Lachnospiraceae bacterium]